MPQLPTGTKPCLTANNRPAFVVNVEVFLRRDNHWLLIRRGGAMSHAAGTISGVGGKVELDAFGEDVFESTGRREVAEEVGVDLTDVPLRYVSSDMFITGDGDPVINVVLTGEAPANATPYPAAPDEVAEVLWLTLEQAECHPNCPEWIRRSLRNVTN